MVKGEREEESYPGEFDRNAFFLKVARKILQTGGLSVVEGMPNIEASAEVLRMSQENEKFLHTRQSELARSGVKGSFPEDNKKQS